MTTKVLVVLGVVFLVLAILTVGCGRGTPTTPTPTAPSAPVVIVANAAIGDDRTIVVGSSGQGDVLIGSYVIQSSCEKPSPGVVSLEGFVYSNSAASGGLSRLRLMRADKAPLRTSFVFDKHNLIGGTLEMDACETIQVDVVADILKKATDGVYYDDRYFTSLALSPSTTDKISGTTDNLLVRGQVLRIIERGTISASIESETTGGSSIKICALGEEGQVLRMDLSVKEERKEVRLLRTGLGSEPSGSPGAGIVSFSFLERGIMIPVFGCRNVGVNVPARELELLGLEARGKVSGLPLPLLIFK